MMSGKTKQVPKKTGKPKDYARASTSKAKGGEPSSDSSGKECVLSFPLLKRADNDRMLPRYSAVLNRTEEEGVGMEDLDALQLELEALLSAVVLRNRVLQEEIANLNSAEEKQRSGDKKSKPGVSSVHKGPLSPGKKIKQERSIKKLKEMGSKSRSDGSLAPLPIKFTKVKSIPQASISRPLPVPPPELDHNELSQLDAPKVVLPKNDTPNKFWTSVEPYCAEISNDDIKLLDDLIAEHDNDAEYQKVPPLGRHYSLRWAQEEFEDHGDTNINKKLRPLANAVESSTTKRSDSANSGPLTQRLLSCLMEENIMVQSQEPVDIRRVRSGGGENTKPTRTFTASNASSLERHIRKELEEQGLLDPTEMNDTADDEILAELRRCQAELKVISNHNLQHLKKLKKLAIEEMARQELKKKLQIADNEVHDVYRKINAARQKKKSPTKEEVAQAWKCLKERELLLKQIDNM